MPTGALLPTVRWQVSAAGGAPVPGAKLHTFLSGTSVPQPVYTDAALTTPHTNPVVADAHGTFPVMYLTAVSHRVRVTTAEGVTVFPDQDNVYDFGQTQMSGGGGGGGGGPHAATHQAGGTDPLPVTSLPGYPGGTANFLRADGTFAAVPGGGVAHASTHQSGGSDPIPVTSLGGYPGGTVNFLRADGTFAAPPAGTGGGGPHAGTHAVNGSDPVSVLTLGGFPGGTTTFLRADGSFAAPMVQQLNGYPGGDHVFLRGDGSWAMPSLLALSGYPGGTTTFLRADGTFAIPPGGAGMTTRVEYHIVDFPTGAASGEEPTIMDLEVSTAPRGERVIILNHPFVDRAAGGAGFAIPISIHWLNDSVVRLTRDNRGVQAVGGPVRFAIVTFNGK